MNKTQISIGGLNFLFKSRDSDIEPLNSLFQKFASRGKPDIEIEVSCKPLPNFSLAKLIFDHQENWRLFQNQENYIVEGYDTRTHKRNKLLIIDKDFRKGAAYMPPEGRAVKHSPQKLPVWSLPRFFSPFGELILIHYLSQREGIMVHGAAVKYRGEGVVFIGPPESGKSTLVRFWKKERETVPLSDETIVIRKQKGRFFVYGTPWGGTEDVNCPENAPIKKIFFIEHALSNKTTPLSPSLAIKNLFPQIFLPLWSKERVTSIISFCHELLSTHGSWKLGFVKQEKVIDFIKNSLLR